MIRSSEGDQYAERQLAIEDLRESTYRQSMEILALSGRREEAAASQNTLFISGTFLQMQVLLAFSLG
jgi:hypothetical protein